MVAALHLYKITLLSNTINNKTTFSFTPPQNHTTLKPYRTCSCAACCFTSPQNYTTFKPIQDMANAPLSLCTPTKLHYSQTIATAVTQNVVLCQYLVQVKMRNFSHFNPPEAQPQCVFFYTIVRIHLVTYSYNGYEFVSYCRKLPDIRKSSSMPACNREF